jgi:hypothetical protein
MYRIHRATAPISAIVTESAMVPGIGEVDILIENTVCGMCSRVAVECRDHKRRADGTQD